MNRTRQRFWVGLWNFRQGVRRFVGGLGRALTPSADGAIPTYLWSVALRRAAKRSLRSRGSARLYFGPEPLISNKYWSDALRDGGADSTAVATHEFENFKGTSFDLTYAQIAEASGLPGWIVRRYPAYVAALQLLRDYDIVHIPYTGGPLGPTPLANQEPELLRAAGIKSVMLPYGGDFWRYSWVAEAEMRHALLLDYPDAGRFQREIDERVERWLREADVVVGGLMVEGASRWDVLATNYVTIADGRVTPRENWSRADGGPGGAVKIVHAPNHRGVKGSEFVLAAIDELKASGLKIELELLERRPNEEVLEAMRAADICIDHCIGSGYGLFAIEAMASGSATMAKLEDEQRIGVHRHFGWLAQCPLVSANIEQLSETIEHLARDPDLREELGRMGVEYVRRFHSDETARHLFGSIHRHLAGEDVDLIRLFHPLTSEYMQRFEPLEPPLRLNRPLGLDA